MTTTFTINNVTSASTIDDLRTELSKQGVPENEVDNVLANCEWSADRAYKPGKTSKPTTITLTLPQQATASKTKRNRGMQWLHAIIANSGGSIAENSPLAAHKTQLLAPINDEQPVRVETTNDAPSTLKRSSSKSLKIRKLWRRLTHQTQDAKPSLIKRITGHDNVQGSNSLLNPIADGTPPSSKAKTVAKTQTQTQLADKLEWPSTHQETLAIIKDPDNLTPLLRLDGKKAATIMDELGKLRFLLNEGTAAIQLLDGFEPYLQAVGLEATDEAKADYLHDAISYTGRFNEDGLKTAATIRLKQNIPKEIRRAQYEADIYVKGEKPDLDPESKAALGIWQVLHKALKAAAHLTLGLGQAQALLTDTVLSHSEVNDLQLLGPDETYDGGNSELFEAQPKLQTKVNQMKEELNDINQRLNRLPAISKALEEENSRLQANQAKREAYLNPSKEMWKHIKTLKNPTVIVSQYDDQIKQSKAKIEALKREQAELIMPEQLEDFDRTSQTMLRKLEEENKRLQPLKAKLEANREKILNPSNKAEWQIVKDMDNPSLFVAKKYDDPIRKIDAELEALKQQHAKLKQEHEQRLEQALIQGPEALQKKADALSESLSQLENRLEQLKDAPKETSRLLQNVITQNLTKSIKSELKWRARIDVLPNDIEQAIDQADQAKLRQWRGSAWTKVKPKNALDEFNKQSMAWDLKHDLKRQTGLDRLPNDIEQAIDQADHAKLEHWSNTDWTTMEKTESLNEFKKQGTVWDLKSKLKRAAGVKTLPKNIEQRIDDADQTKLQHWMGAEFSQSRLSSLFSSKEAHAWDEFDRQIMASDFRNTLKQLGIKKIPQEMETSIDKASHQDLKRWLDPNYADKIRDLAETIKNNFPDSS